MRGRNLTEQDKDRIFELWQDKTPTKAIAIELGRSYACIYFHLKRRNLVG
jgi:IS30 family transposase